MSISLSRLISAVIPKPSSHPPVLFFKYKLAGWLVMLLNPLAIIVPYIELKVVDGTVRLYVLPPTRPLPLLYTKLKGAHSLSGVLVGFEVGCLVGFVVGMTLGAYVNDAVG